MTKELEFILNIVKQAGEISTHDFVVRSKGDKSKGDLVTNLDEEIERFLIAEIKKAYPDFDIVSEEFNFDNKVTKNCFTIDPIDGTINFANGVPLWGIQVACIKGGKTVAAAINMARINHLFYADKNGAFLNGNKISVKQTQVKNALFSLGWSNVLPFYEKVCTHTHHFRRFGAACVDFAFVAMGAIGGAVFKSDKPWDYVPGLYICKMAGAVTADESGFHAAAMSKEFLDVLRKETAPKFKKNNIL